MGSKRNPGAFDCYAAAHPDEPMFVLLGRDRHAPMLVTLWALLRELDGEDASKVAEARECALRMRTWRQTERAVDKELLDWALPILTGEDEATADRRTQAVTTALLAGKTGLDVLTYARLLAP